MKSAPHSSTIDLFKRAAAFHAAGQLASALAAYDRVVTIDPRHAGAFCGRGDVLTDLGRFDPAIASYDRAIALDPTDGDAHDFKGIALAQIGRNEEALVSFDRAIALQPNLIQAHFSRAATLTKLERHEAAIVAYQRVIELDPGHAQALSQLAEAMIAMGRRLEATAYYGRAFAMLSDQTEGRIRQITSLGEQKRLEDELEVYRQAVARNANDPYAFGNMGAALTRLGRLEEAISAFDRAIAIDPNLAYVYRNRSTAFNNLGQLDAAIESYDKAVALDPTYDDTPGLRLLWALSLCKWDGFEQRAADVAKQIEAGGRPPPPFTLLLFNDSPDLHRKCAEAFGVLSCPKQPSSPIVKKYPRHDRIRIGYFSADFHLHATMQLIADMLAAHDKTRFELFGFSFGAPSVDEWRRRATTSFDHFFDVSAVSDLDVARQARELEIDIGVDLKGFTQGCRTGIFAERAAPIQVNFLGYPGTMGAFFEYLIADRTLIPESSKNFYSENIVYLPGSYQPNCRNRIVGDGVIIRRDFGLPETGIIYCCFNQSCKINPHMFDMWMDILKSVDNSVIWLWVFQKAAADSLRNGAEEHGIDPERIVFATPLPVEEHLSRLRLADVFLDTLPYNAHTTGSDALRMGVPMVTCVGASFASRVASSLLNAIDMPELITTNLDDYKALAVDLGRNPQRLAALKEMLRLNAQTSSLFDGSDFARKLEHAYLRMYDRYQGGQPPVDIYL